MRTTAEGEADRGRTSQALAQKIGPATRLRESRARQFSPVEEPAAPRSRKRSGWLIALVGGVADWRCRHGGSSVTVDLSALQSSQETDQYLKNLYNRGQALLAVEDYDGAIAAFQELLSTAPEDREAQVGLERAKRLRTLDQLYAEAEQLIEDEDWNAAAERLQSIIELDPELQGCPRPVEHGGATTPADCPVRARARPTMSWATGPLRRADFEQVAQPGCQTSAVRCGARVPVSIILERWAGAD